MEHEYDIQRYLNADRVIRCLEKRKRLITKEIYNQTLTTHLSYDGLTVHVEAPRIENIVLDNIMACDCVERKIQRWKLRAKYFTEYLLNLPESKRERLKEGVVDDETLDEIREIETAIAFHHEYEPPKERIEWLNDLFEDIELLAEVL